MFMSRHVLTRWISFLAVLALLSCPSYAIRNGSISSTVHPSSITARGYFGGVHFRFGGGVVPRAGIVFQFGEQRIELSELKLTVLNESIGLVWKDEFYELPIRRELVCPLTRFVARGSYIAFTIPPIEIEEQYLAISKLIPAGGGYVAEEFARGGCAQFLMNVDLSTTTEEIPDELERSIIQSINGDTGQEAKFNQHGSYVNADFHVTYIGHLVEGDEGRQVDIEGLPLRYYWEIGANGKGTILAVESFEFPEKSDEIQTMAVLFFQTAAVLRQFKREDADGFAQFVQTTCEQLELPKE